MTQIDVKKAKENFNEIITLASQGEEVIIAQNDHPIVRLTAIAPPKKRREFGSAKGMIEMSDDFDEPLEDFKEYM